MTTRHLRGAALVLMLSAMLFACSDDTDPPPPDFGNNPADGPKVVPDGQLPQEGGTPPKDGPGVDKPPAPTVITAHMEEACSTGLYSINVAPGQEESTCTDIQTKGIKYLQLLFGDSESKPPTTGRTYTVKAQSQVNIYPADGEATAVYIATPGTQGVKSGTVTVNPYAPGATVFTGSFTVTLDDNTQVSATFLSDFCPFDPSDCV